MEPILLPKEHKELKLDKAKPKTEDDTKTKRVLSLATTKGRGAHTTSTGHPTTKKPGSQRLRILQPRTRLLTKWAYSRKTCLQSSTSSPHRRATRSLRNSMRWLPSSKLQVIKMELMVDRKPQSDPPSTRGGDYFDFFGKKPIFISDRMVLNVGWYIQP